MKEVAGTSSKKVDGDFPTSTRHNKKTTTVTTQEKTKTCKGRGGGRLKHYNVDGDVPLCLRKTEEKSKDGSSSKKKKNEEKCKRKQHTNRMKDGSKSTMESGCKDLCGDSTGKKTKKKQRCHVFRATKI